MQSHTYTVQQIGRFHFKFEQCGARFGASFIPRDTGIPHVLEGHLPFEFAVCSVTDLHVTPRINSKQLDVCLGYTCEYLGITSERGLRVSAEPNLLQLIERDLPYFGAGRLFIGTLSHFGDVELLRFPEVENLVRSQQFHLHRYQQNLT